MGGSIFVGLLPVLCTITALPNVLICCNDGCLPVHASNGVLSILEWCVLLYKYAKYRRASLQNLLPRLLLYRRHLIMLANVRCGCSPLPFWLELSAPVGSTVYLCFAISVQNVVKRANSPPWSVCTYVAISPFKP